MLKSNHHYFNMSIKNPEGLDEKYMFLNWDKDIDKYVLMTKKLKELLATIKTLREKKHNADEIYDDLYKLITSKFASKSELNCFINACDSTTKTIKNDFVLFKQIVDLYLKHRDFTEITPKEWIQAIIDKGASRAKGCVGEDKLVQIAKSLNFEQVFNWDSFFKAKKAIAKFSKNNFDAKSIKNNLGIDLNFKSQGKMLDLIIKNGNTYVFLEAKHLKEGGGSQDKQIKELIDIIKTPNENKNVYHCAFLDGVYSNDLLKDIKSIDKNQSGKNKIISQQIDIQEALDINKNSYWLNTVGFEEFIKDF